MRLTKMEFINAIYTIESMMRTEDKIIDAMNINPEWIPGLWIGGYIDLIIKLSDIPEDPIEDNLISYFIFDLEFGKKWQPGDYVVNGVDTPLQNVEQLWNAITG